VRKGVLLATLVILLCLVVSFAVPSLRVVQANPIYTPGMLTAAIIESPKNGRTYTTNTIPVIIITGDHQCPSNGYYSLDGGQEIKINENVHGGDSTYKTTLHLADGRHTIHVRTETLGSACATTIFTVNTTLPFVTILSPENKVYNTSTIPLHFELLNERLFNEYDVNEVTYNLDDKGNTTVRILRPSPPQFPEELTWYPLANLTDGKHNVVVYAKDDIGNGFSAQVSFEVKTSNPTLTPSIVPSATTPNAMVDSYTNLIFPLLTVFSIVVLAVVVVLVIRFKKLKSKTLSLGI
jgi:hypothetical protein